jgi:hypothetical protein
MTEPPRDPDPPPVPPAAPPSPPALPLSPEASQSGEPRPADALTPEEQMERFAQELKETDWGHQPC